MGAADLDDVLEGVDFLLEGVAQASDGGKEVLLEVDDSGDVHDGGEGVV